MIEKMMTEKKRFLKKIILVFFSNFFHSDGVYLLVRTDSEPIFILFHEQATSRDSFGLFEKQIPEIYQ